MTVRKKLIEVSIPLEAINVASAREKSIRHGHPSTLHLWWARRPLAACRAVLFCQLVDDPSSWPERFPTEEAVDAERRRLHKLIGGTKEREYKDGLVAWESSNDERVLDAARWEIARSVAWGLGEEPPARDDPAAILAFLQTKAPPVYDPFSGGGSIPLEAQRLGLRAYGSDLNPVAVLIGKALVEIPPKFAGRAPVNPEADAHMRWKGAQGLAEDVRFYGRWMREQAELRIGHLYPTARAIRLPRKDSKSRIVHVDPPLVERWRDDVARGAPGPVLLAATKAAGRARPDLLLDGCEPEDLTVIAWLWARTVRSPDPAAKGAMVPLVSSFMLSTKEGSKTWIEPVIEAGAHDGWRFVVRTGKPTKAEEERLKQGTKAGRGTHFTCVLTGAPIAPDHVRDEGMAGRVGARLMAVVAEGARARVYLSPMADHERAAAEAEPGDVSAIKVDMPDNARWFSPPGYGMKQYADIFTPRQLVALTTFSDLVGEARTRARADAARAGLPNDPRPIHEGGAGAEAYADAVATYLSFALSKLADRGSSICTWFTERDSTRPTYARQAIPMSWDFAELNTLLFGTGSFEGAVMWTAESVEAQGVGGSDAAINRIDAAKNSFPVRPTVFSTDPPYYDNIGYADLSDFFYVWLRRSLSGVWPDLFRRLTTPKAEELVATPYRHGGKPQAEAFFMAGMSEALAAMRAAATEGEPLTIYYAFKQAEIAQEGVTSAGWATFLQAVVDAGLMVDGTWPVRTELGNRMIASGTNALASSIVLVCRKRPEGAPVASRSDFLRALRRDMPAAIEEIRKAGVGPVDMQQSVIGPGMGVFSRHARILEDDDSRMSVRTALALINRVWGEIESEIEGTYDPATQVALAWFAACGFDPRPAGELITLANAKDIPLGGLFASGVFTDLRGRAALTARDELPADWRPSTDRTPTIWECAQHVARTLRAEEGGAAAAAALIAEMGEREPPARALCHRLFQIATDKGWAQEALVWNELAQEWPRLGDLAAEVGRTAPGPAQGVLI